MDFCEQILHTLTRQPDGRAIEFDGRWYSWGEVARIGERLEAVLVAAGVPHTTRIGLIVRNRVAHAAVLLGFIARRRPVTMIYAFQSPEALARELRSLRLAVVVAAQEDWSATVMETLRETGIHALVLPADPDQPVASLEASGSDALQRAVAVCEPGIEVLTSGTTGPPKRIPIRFEVLNRAVASATLEPQAGEPPVQINVWPLGGVGGICVLCACAANGQPMSLLEKFSLDAFVQSIRRNRPPTLGLSPVAVRLIVDGQVPKEDLASVTAVFGGSAPLAPDLQDRFEQIYGIPIYWGYGATEFCGSVIRWTPTLRAAFGDSKRGSIGKAMPGVDIMVVDAATGERAAVGHEGLLAVRVPQIDPDWVTTSDLALIDADGFVFHRGRNDGAILRGGFKVLPERVIEVLRLHPAVADAAVVGVDDHRLGQVPAAAVEIRGALPWPSAMELEAHVRSHLPATHVPVRFALLDSLPRTPSMKVDLPRVRQLFES